MKKFLIVILLLFPGLIQAQGKSDTIHVSPGSTTYLAFPEDISLVDIGNKDYAFKVEKNILLLRSELSQGRITDMLVKFGNELFTAWIVHDLKPARSLYDYRKIYAKKSAHMAGASVPAAPLLPEEDKKTEPVSTGGFRDSMISKHLSMLGNREEKFRTCGLVKHSMIFMLVNVMNDSACTYLRFKVSNRSTLPYNLDYISFECLKRGQRESKILQPVFSTKPRQVPGRGSVFLSYALPSYALGEGGSYLVTFRESDGNRKAMLSIPAKTVALAGTFQEEHEP